VADRPDDRSAPRGEPHHRTPHDPHNPLTRELERLSPTGHIDTVQASELLEPEPHWFNLPNALTFLRALLVPVIVWFLAKEDPGARWWAFGIFVFAAATDSIDGWVARRWHGVTRWGQLADPIADKLLIIGSLASLAAVNELPWWAVWVTLVREVAVTGLRVVLVRRLDLVMPASHWGKIKTISQVIAVSLFLWPQVGEDTAMVVLYVSIALTLWSGLDYAFRAGRLARERRGP
jgi:CDP-diacylglycerol--glycerol-3-phosphate 3-phosphatidyltransferase